MQLDADDHFFSGDLKQLANWKYFGANVHAAADGVVVSTVDGQPNQVPGGFARGATLETANGNAIVEDIGNGDFALYAHLRPGSLLVKKGYRIRQGQVMALLGNSGNTNAPHLHFHIVDGPSPLDSNGLPFEFTSSEVQGRVTSAEALDAGLKGSKVPVDRTARPSAHHNQMPLVLDVMNFPSSSTR
jgi:murein DD-endopeptidase MepM/ murein hydrolase activator NlpD